MKPLCIDLYCGRGGWAQGFLAEGYDVIGFDIERHPYPGQLVLQDVRTLDGSQFAKAACIVASPPCEEFTRHHLPWCVRRNPPEPDLSMIVAAQKIAAESRLPFVMENVVSAQRWIGRARWHYGSRYLWGDVPAIMPYAERSFKEHLSSKAKAERARIPIRPGAVGRQKSQTELGASEMAKNGNDKDMQTGRPAKDEQMTALKKAQGTPTRQSELPPYISKDAMPDEKD